MDFGQGDEWTEARSVDWHLLNFPLQGGLQRCVADLHRVYRSQPALHEVDFDWHGFEWLESHDNENSVFAFLRKALDPNNVVAVACNFTPVPRYGYRIGEGTVEGFYDAGSVWQRQGPAVLRHSVGFGYKQGIFILTTAFPIRNGRVEPVFMAGMNY